MPHFHTLTQTNRGNQARRPIKDADGLELFKLQVWWFLCISCNDDEDWDDWANEGGERSKGASSWSSCVCAALIGEMLMRHWEFVPVRLAQALVMHWNLISLLALLLPLCRRRLVGAEGGEGRRRPCAEFKWRNRATNQLQAKHMHILLLLLLLLQSSLIPSSLE